MYNDMQRFIMTFLGVEWQNTPGVTRRGNDLADRPGGLGEIRRAIRMKVLKNSLEHGHAIIARPSWRFLGNFSRTGGR
jgi:hypothetical protein